MRYIIIALLVLGGLTVACNSKSANEVSGDVNAPMEDVLIYRAKTRAFYTAPPVIPHEIGEGENCMECHGEGDGYMRPHKYMQNCRQCHIAGDRDREPIVVDTDWRGLTEPKPMRAITVVSPPLIPHRIFLRENCNACHNQFEDEDGGLASPHSSRTNCRQCHLPANNREFEISR